jgi:hypothetical protein
MGKKKTRDQISKFPFPPKQLFFFLPEGEGSLILFSLKEKTIFFPQGIWFEKVTQRFFFHPFFYGRKKFLIKRLNLKPFP